LTTALRSGHGSRVVAMKFTTIAGQSLSVEAVPLLEPERQALREPLRKRDVKRAHLAIIDAYERLDARIESTIASSGLLPACHRGCEWCCHGVKINVTALEALAIAERVRLEGEQLCLAVKAAAERRHNMNTDQLFNSGDPCPFLGASGECKIYDVRPMACRRHCCLDSSECERAVKNPELKLPVSQHAPISVVGAIAGLALAAAVQDAGLDYRSFELASAVSIALRQDAAQRWVEGDRIFDGAVRPVDVLDREISKADMKKYSPNCARAQSSVWRSHGKKRNISKSKPPA
jgi:Fe-S-cluster containining protein